MNKPAIVRRALVGVVGLAAAAGLFTSTPAEESGRVVTVAPVDGGLVVTHVSGPEHRTAYRDLVGMWTICDGDTQDVRPGMGESREGCLDRLERQLVAHAKPVMVCVPTLAESGRDNQRWAFVSLAYNIGVGAACGSTAAKRFRARDWAGGCDAILMWDKAGKPPRAVRGLTLRRQREREICRRGL